MCIYLQNISFGEHIASLVVEVGGARVISSW